MMSRFNRGYILLTLAQLAIACNVVIGKHLSQFMPVYTFVGGRFIFSSLILAALKHRYQTPICDPLHPQGKLQKYDWKLLLGQAFTAGFLFNVCFYLGLNYTTATSAGIIASTLPGVLALLAFFILKEKLNPTKLAGIFLAMAGIMILGLDNNPTKVSDHGSWLGDILVFLAIIPEAYYSILAKKLNQRVTAMGGALLVNMLSFVMLLPLMLQGLLTSHPAQWPLETLLFTMAGGFLSSLFFVGWSKGLETVPASTAGIFGGVLPVATTLLAILFLGESLSWASSLGMLCVFGSLWLATEHSSKVGQKETATSKIIIS